MSDDIHEVAARWHQAQQHDDMDWAAFADWLEADPRHRIAYDDIALFEERVDRALPVIEPATAPEEAPRHQRPWLLWGGAAAAMLAVTIGIGSQFGPDTRPAPTIIVASAGKTRDLTLPGGISATLAAGSRIERGQAAGAPIRLAGAAWFDIAHDPARTLVIEANGYEIRDIGTRFAVTTAPGMIRVGVEQGQVVLHRPAGGDDTVIRADEAATAFDGDAQVRVTSTRAATISGWRDGRFTYEDAPLALVTADIARFTGQTIALDPGLARRSFSGVLAAGDRDTMITALEQLTGLHARRDGQTVRLGNRAGG